MRDNFDIACHAGNGKPGWRTKMDIWPAHCVPCPEECEKCEKPGTSDIGKGKDSWFKCILPTVENPTPVPLPWKCKSVQDRRGHPGQFQWCKYRHDLAKTSTNGKDLEPSSAWELAITASRCDKTEDHVDEQIAAVINALTPKLNQLSEENCELCRVMFGGSVASEETKEIVVGQAKTSLQAWADTRCAWDELGLTACRQDRGRTGWGKVHKCAPCPHECHSCEDSTAMFSSKKKIQMQLAVWTRPCRQNGRTYVGSV